MANYDVTVFRTYPFAVGQKIRIEGSKRAGDWEVVGIDERSVELRCPVSGKTFKWDRFCYYVEDEQHVAWPRED